MENIGIYNVYIGNIRRSIRWLCCDDYYTQKDQFTSFFNWIPYTYHITCIYCQLFTCKWISLGAQENVDFYI